MAVLLECFIYALFFIFQRRQILAQRKKQALVEEEIQQQHEAFMKTERLKYDKNIIKQSNRTSNN